MFRRDLRRVAVAGALLCLGVAAAEPTGTRTALEEVASRARPEVALYYSRAVAPEELSDFRHYLGVQLGLGALVDPTVLVKASLSLDRELGAPIEAFRASNTTVSASKYLQLDRIGLLRPSVFVRLPTHDEDRYYLSYRGSFGGGVTLLNERVYTVGDDHAFGGGLALTGARNLFQYTTSREGALSNRLWSIGGTAYLVYTLYQKLSFTLSFRNSLYWTWEGRDNDRYEVAGAIQYIGPKGLRLSLMSVTSDRTFQYDQVSANVNLYKPENTLVVFTVAYAPNFEAL